MNMIGIIGAMEVEVETLKQHMTEVELFKDETMRITLILKK